MAWENKRKIHIARGSESEIITASQQNTNEFTDGQPLHIEGSRNYLSIANTKGLQTTSISPILMEPIKVREVKGYISDINTNHKFTLSAPTENDEDNMYIFTDEKDDSGKGNAYINVGGNLGLSFKRAGNEIASIPQGNDYFLINPNYYLKSANIQTSNINDITGGSAINISNTSSGITLYKPLSTNYATNIAGKLTSNTETELKTSTTINDNLYINANTTINNILHNQTNELILNFIESNIKSKSLNISDTLSILGTLTTNNATINNLYAGTSSPSESSPLYVTNETITINKPFIDNDVMTLNGNITVTNDLIITGRLIV